MFVNIFMSLNLSDELMNNVCVWVKKNSHFPKLNKLFKKYLSSLKTTKIWKQGYFLELKKLLRDALSQGNQATNMLIL